ncbi:MAG TPA: hypothetical protein VGQ57_07750, partial [Polyangiaceae bacterium]|nr:hypothetical protein [Polyangiaceae bacterium]
MSDPERWLDAPEISSELQNALRSAPRARSLDPRMRARVGTRLGRASVLPVTALAWLSLKSAAALGLAGGAAVAGVLAVAERYTHAPELAVIPVAAPHGRGAPERRPGPARPAPRAVTAPEATGAPPEPAPTAAIPPLNPPSDLPRTPSVATTNPLSPSGTHAPASLAEESALLEQARRALAS